MSTKEWFVKWQRPCKIFKGEKIGEWKTFQTKELAEQLYKEVSRMEDVTNLEMGETEVCYLSLPLNRKNLKTKENGNG